MVYDVHYLSLRFHRRRRPALHSSGFPVDTQNITFTCLAGYAAEERTCSGAHTGLSPSHTCHKPTISAASPSRRNTLSSTSLHEAMLKRSNALFFSVLELQWKCLWNLAETTWKALTTYVVHNCTIFRRPSRVWYQTLQLQTVLQKAACTTTKFGSSSLLHCSRWWVCSSSFSNLNWL